MKKIYAIRLSRKKNLRNFHFQMVACTSTSSISPGPPEMTEVYVLKKKNETGKQENLPELLMEQKVQLESPETKEGPPKGASERGQCHVQPTKEGWARASAPK